jgi:NAD(P)-dependent dehydrogenase (short-subunit alcohol dehydrogenase family)
MSRLQGRTALVTGAASGIGAAIARRFMEEGARVWAADRQVAALEQTARQINCDFIELDVTRAEQVQVAVDRMLQACGRLDIVVNAAGVVRNDDVGGIDDAEWALMLDVNLSGAMRVCRAALPAMRRQRKGAVVNIASVAAFNASAGMASYAASKAGLVAMTRALANAYGSEGIRANCLCPGWVRTPMSIAEMQDLARTSGTTEQEEFDKLTARIALKRVAEPSEMAACAAFLASDDASFVTGAVLVADGGAKTPATARAL